MLLRLTARSLLFAACCLSGGVMWGQGATVSLQVQLERVHSTEPGAKSPQDKRPSTSSADVVVWLSPEGSNGIATAPPGLQQSYRMVQKDKQFTPHLLVVPTGSSVEFPNQDPFFHNVFSLFNGKRFDLGLYEAGSHRSVRFDREGVSYIFCNIHPQMGSVIVSLRTPYVAISTADGKVTLRGVPPGSYRLHLWAEEVSGSLLQKAERDVRIQGDDLQLGEVRLLVTKVAMAGHKNKFGDDYKNESATPY